MTIPEEAGWPLGSTPVGFILRLAKALHIFGAPSYELERTVTALSAKLGFQVQAFALPTMITLAVFDQDRYSSFLIRVEPGEINLEKLTRTQALAFEVLQDETDVEHAAEVLKKIFLDPVIWGGISSALSFGLVSAGVARIFNGGWKEIVSGGLIGIFVGLLTLNAGRNRIFSHLFPTLASVIAAFSAYALAYFLGHDSVYATLLSGLIVLLPGLTITVGLAELATQNLVSGTARLAGAGILFVQMGFGVVVGDQLGAHLFTVLPHTNLWLFSPWTEWLGVLCASLGLVVLFQAQRRDAGWILLAGLIAYGSAKLGTRYAGPFAGAFLGAFIIGTTSHIFRFITGRSNQLMLLPGIILLVPGNIGFKSLKSLLDQDALVGLETGFSMLLVGTSLVIGLLMSSIFILPTRRKAK